eukprot:7299846-Lingulodinium_polyedra.AAC.1
MAVWKLDDSVVRYRFGQCPNTQPASVPGVPALLRRFISAPNGPIEDGAPSRAFGQHKPDEGG